LRCSQEPILVRMILFVLKICMGDRMKVNNVYRQVIITQVGEIHL
jgi:hypothetical protein